jgi:hypothetical protein
MYPGIIPLKPENEIQLFNLKTDPTEDHDLSEENPAMAEKLMNEYKQFEASINPFK